MGTPQQVFVDSDVDPNTLLTFREVLLKSSALENLAESLLFSPASDDAEQEMILKVYGYCLVGSAAAAKRLTEGLSEVCPLSPPLHLVYLETSRCRLLSPHESHPI